MLEMSGEVSEVKEGIEEAATLYNRGLSPPAGDQVNIDLSHMGPLDATHMLEEVLALKNYQKAVQLLHIMRHVCMHVCVCTCTCMHTCVCTCMCIHVCTCMCVCMCVHACVCTCMCVCMCVHACVYMQRLECARVSTCVHVLVKP